MTEELIATAVAAAASVVGLTKGISYLMEQKNGGGGKNATKADLVIVRDEWKTWCNERHKNLDIQRAEFRVDSKGETIEINKKIDSMMIELKLEILGLSRKIDDFLKFIPK